MASLAAFEWIFLAVTFPRSTAGLHQHTSRRHGEGMLTALGPFLADNPSLVLERHRLKPLPKGEVVRHPVWPAMVDPRLLIWRYLACWCRLLIGHWGRYGWRWAWGRGEKRWPIKSG